MSESTPERLGDDCGHHCGIMRTGRHKHVGHCPCKECHGAKPKKKRARKKVADG